MKFVHYERFHDYQHIPVCSLFFFFGIDFLVDADVGIKSTGTGSSFPSDLPSRCNGCVLAAIELR